MSSVDARLLSGLAGVHGSRLCRASALRKSLGPGTKVDLKRLRRLPLLGLVVGKLVLRLAQRVHVATRSLDPEFRRVAEAIILKESIFIP